MLGDPNPGQTHRAGGHSGQAWGAEPQLHGGCRAPVPAASRSSSQECQSRTTRGEEAPPQKAREDNRRSVARPAGQTSSTHRMTAVSSDRLFPQGPAVRTTAPGPPAGPSVGPGGAPAAHLVLELVIADVLQVDEHVEIRTKHARLQGFGCHLQGEGTGLGDSVWGPDERPPLSPHTSSVTTAN